MSLLCVPESVIIVSTKGAETNGNDFCGTDDGWFCVGRIRSQVSHSLGRGHGSGIRPDVPRRTEKKF